MSTPQVKEEATPLPKGLSDLEKQLAKEYTGTFAWPTIMFAVLIFISFIYICIQGLQGDLPLLVCTLINSILAYWAFTPQHDAMHGAISGVKGKHDNITCLDQCIGWMCTLVLSLPFTYRIVHLRHHKYTNDPEQDVDYYSHADTVWQAMTGPYKQARDGLFILRKLANDPVIGKQFRSGYVWFAFQFSVILVALFTGYILEVFLLWLIPGYVGITMLSVLFQWLPHHPHDGTGRYGDTRVTLFTGGTFLLLSQNVHLIHHMFPRIPFYTYPKVFKALRPELEQRGAAIVTHNTQGS